ncbi:MAG: hypothetical protein WCX77_02655 [Candidatus Paceibacterota bacterium]|jgi:hypothetical protein
MEKLKNDLSKWAEAHVFYDKFTNNSIDPNDKIAADENIWRNEAIHNTPNGKLLADNSFFKSLRKNTVYLAHITPNLHNILEQNNLYPSGGCLVGGIYCVPIEEKNGKMRLHNLGEYILKKEMPRLLGAGTSDLLNVLIVKINLPNIGKNKLSGIDYLRLGNIHFDIYRRLEYLLSFRERESLEKICTQRISRSMDYLGFCNKMYCHGQKIDSNKFLKALYSAIDHLPILGYFYFEIISEYIMLFQDNASSVLYKKMGEFFSPSYKNIVPDLSPQLAQNFSLRQFHPKIEEVIDYLDKNLIFKNFDKGNFIDYVIKRLCFLTNARLFDNKACLTDWNKIQCNFDCLAGYMAPLLGHLIHRELRTFKRYPYFYFYFDQYKALQIWNYWNHMDIVIPFNGIMPKGEVGINPAYTNLDYEIFTSRIYDKNGCAYLEPKERTKINIVPKLVDLKFTSMRNKDHQIISQKNNYGRLY